MPLVPLSSPPWQNRLWVICICAGMLLFFTQVTVLFPVLPLYLIQRWGETAPVGWVVGALAAGLLFFRPWIGMLLDRWGRKPVLWLGLLIMLGILPLYLWSPNPLWLMGVRVLHGISQAALATASQTMLVDLVPPHRRTAMLGYLAMSNTIGFSLGPLMGSSAFATGGFEAVVQMQLILTVVGFVISLPLPWLMVRSAQSAQSEVQSARGELSATQTSPIQPSEIQASEARLTRPSTDFPWKHILSFPVREATFVFFIGSFLHGGVVTFLPLFIPNAAQFYSLNAFVAILVRFGLGRWGNVISQRWIVSLGVLCSGSALIGLSQLPEYLIFWSIIYGLGFGTLFPVLSAIVSLAAPAALRGRIYSFFLAGFDGGMTLGGAGVQPLIQVLPLSTIFALLGGVGCGVSGFAFRRFAGIRRMGDR
ncbi:MFS transporter [Egbenema bharatensis]|uniref:MFS transporter n=1 Tax=Egbenema bharatensis TaxID=3463334 RepID=UPI003A86A21B